MSTRRGGKKKTQQKQQQQQLLQLHQDQDQDQDMTTLTTTTTTKPAASPAIALAKQALLSPVVTAARAISTAATAVLAPTTTTTAMPAIPEDDATTSADAAATLDNEVTPKTTHHGGGTARKAKPAPFLSATAQKLFSDDGNDDDGDDDEEAGEDQQDQQQQTHHQHSGLTAAAPSSTQHTTSASLEDPDDNEQLLEHQPSTAGHQLRATLQRLCGSTSSIGWKGALALALLLLLVPLLAAVLVRQGQMLQVQAHALQAQQQQVAAQAQALYALQKQLKDTSSQLPGLLNTAQDTRSSLSSLTAEQSALLRNLQGLSNLTQQLVDQVHDINGTAQAGTSAWQLLAAVTGTNCTAQPGHAACPSAHSGTAAAAAASAGTTTAANTSTVLEALMQLLSQEQQQDTEHLQQQQEQLAQRQQELLHSLPHTIQQQVQQAMSAQLPPLDLALADCGGHVVFTSAVNISAFHSQLGYQHPQPNPAHTGGSSSNGPASILQHLQRSLLQHVRLPGARVPATPAASAAAGQSANSSSSAATPDLLLHRSEHHPGSLQGVLASKHQQLLHRVLLRPASKLLPSACVPMVVGAAAGGDDNGGRPAVIEIQLPQPAHVHSITLHIPSSPGTGAGTAAWPAPGRVRLALRNSSTCGGAAVPCTRVDGSPEVAGAVGGTHKLGAEAFGAAGRAVLRVEGGGGVLADRVVVQLMIASGEAGGGGMTCVGRISVQGRPTDPAAFC